jgi:hypothetical protein
VKRILELEQQLMKEGGNPSNGNLVESNKKLTEELNELKMEKSRMTSQLEVHLIANSFTNYNNNISFFFSSH